MNKCPVCNEKTYRTVLVEVVHTFEPVNNELVETTWHKKCFVTWFLENTDQGYWMKEVERIREAKERANIET